ncbi:CHASE domain-containing protein [Aquabacterium sp. OR-4]|uniref:CHASE domain-containing protein n=1 Tax=Aquabacterium sp. OR-4 TaxID=2978127 RepID=UPI0021B291FF|nr:CHASE domain-containing protein [Aquabacterium sp. OR-4]MDT7834460.1 CHASE domain-containing protein [Aquabacterium sp. OR-4]
MSQHATTVTAVPGLGRRGAVRAVLGTALAYLVAGQLALLLAIPPSNASPLYPASGVAVAALLVHGGRALPGVLLGALAVQWPHGVASEPTLASWLVALAIALGATLQAWACRWLLMRGRTEAPALSEPGEVLAFGLLTMLGCGVSASVATLGLSLGGVLGAGERLSSWWTWWLGDTLGVLIGAPMVLAWIGRPRAHWAARRFTLSLPLLVATCLLTAGATMVTRWEAQRVRTVFERDAAQAAAAVDAQLLAALYTLEAMRGVFVASQDVSAMEMRRAAAPWLAMALPVQAIGHAERLTRDAVPGFETRARDLDGRSLRVFDRRDGDTPADGLLMAIRYIEPEDRNLAALGLNSRSVPIARAAIDRATLTDAAAVTAPFELTQRPGDESGVVVYRALYGDSPVAQADARRAALRGVVFVTLRTQAMQDAARQGARAYLDWCLVDADAGATRRRLAGPPGCDKALRPEGAPGTVQTGDQLSHRRSLAFAGRRWDLLLSARATQVPDTGRGNAWLFSLGGLAAAALLTSLLLVVTGRTRRIEAAVAERTAELEREIAERERTESALRDSERRFRNVFDQAPVGVAYGDLDGRIREANPRLREMAGLSSERLSRRRLLDLLQPEDRDAAAVQLHRLRHGGPPEVWPPARLRRPDGQEMWVQTQCSVLLDAVGRPERLVAVMEDITERRHRQAAEQGRALAETANRAKSEFLSRMSHELRTPLNAMLGFAQLLELDRRQPLATHQAAWAAQILRAGWHLLEMINDTLDLSRIEAGEMRLQPARLALAPLIQHCAAMLEAAAAQRGIQLQVSIDAKVPEVLADDTRLRQVLTNLLSNAVKYNVDQGLVIVSAQASADGQTVELRVCDTGLGLSDAQMAELFQPFNRLGRENGTVEGTGIGLVISRRLAELMGGSLHAERGRGQAGQAAPVSGSGSGLAAPGSGGATFVLRLPVAPPVVSDGETPRERNGQLPVPGYRQRHVHYIEDNETNVEVLRGILLQRPQVRLSVSTLGLEGLAAMRSDPPDLLLLDMHLPDIDGLDLLEQFRRDPVCAQVPVVALSADATPARVQQALASGARHYLTKPLDLPQFLAVLDAQLSA